MVNGITKNIKLLVNWLKYFAVLLIIGTAILVLIGRQTIAGLDQLRPNIQSFIASNTGMQIKLGRLSGQWQGLVPSVEVESFQMFDADNNPVMDGKNGRAYLDFFNTIRHQVPIWRELVIEDLAVDFVEDKTGRWNLRGFASQSDSELDFIAKPFFYSQFIRLQSVAINLQSFAGNKTHFLASDMLIENESDFHRAQLSLSLNKEDTPAYMLFEGQGDPADLDSFYAEGYLKFDNLNFSEQLLRFTKSLIPDLSNKLSISPLEAQGEFWIDVHPGGGFDFEGDLSVSKLPLTWLDNVAPITDLQTQITGWFTPGINWGANFQKLGFNWSDIRLQPDTISFSQYLNADSNEFDLSFRQLDLELLSDLLIKSQLIEAPLLAFIQQAKPGGRFSSAVLSKKSDRYQLSTNLEQFYMHPFKGMPGCKEVDGYLELNASDGLFHISDADGFQLFMPKQYRDYQPFDSAQGTVFLDWTANSDQLLIRSNPIATQTPGGRGKIMFSVKQPLPSNGQVPEFNLLAAGINLDASYGSKLLPYKMPELLSSWLKASIKEGNVQEFAMLFRSGPPRGEKISRTSQLMFKTKDLTVKYHPEWPSMSELDATILVDDGNLDMDINSAKVGEVFITKGLMAYDPSVTADQRRLIIDASASGDLAQTINVLADSPLREKLGPLPQWDYKGKSATQLHLEIPLTPNSFQKTLTSTYKITSVIKDADLLIKGTPIVINDLSGSLLLTPEVGVFSDDLSATVWEKPLTAGAYKSNKQQKFSFKTTLSPNNLNRFVELPWAEIISGDLPIEGQIDLNISESSNKISISSSMQGVELDLPKPFSKSAMQKEQLDMQFYFEPTLSRLTGTLGDSLTADFYFSNRQFESGVVAYDRPSVAAEKGQIIVAAHLPTLEIDDWKPVLDRLQLTQRAQQSTRQTILDFELDYLNLAGLNLQAINAKIKTLPEGLNISLVSDLATGQIKIPSSKEQVPLVDLSSIKFAANTFQQSSQYKAIDPRRFTSLDFTVDQLKVGDQLLGSLSFELRPEPSGAAFNNISGDLLGIQPGVFATEAPTEFFWSYDGKNHSSRMVGPMGVKDIADFMHGFGMPKFLDSQSGKLDLNLSWQAQPWAISKDTIQGDLRLNLTDGSFYRSSGGAEATLKMISLLNFANWLRRLKLDFSDVVGKNLAYNKLDGFLNFNQGILQLKEPLKIDMPSGKMSLGGEFNLVAETVNAKLVATLPVGVNLPWLVGLAGGLPAAAGVFITSKLAQKQVDRLSSISYTLGGSWDDIEVAVDEIFAAELSNDPASP